MAALAGKFFRTPQDDLGVRTDCLGTRRRHCCTVFSMFLANLLLTLHLKAGHQDIDRDRRRTEPGKTTFPTIKVG